MLRLTPWPLLLLAAVLRAYGCLITPVPGRDGVAYLWVAERVATGEPGALFDSVFHPLYPLLIAFGLRCGPTLDPVTVGQLVAAATAAVAILPLWRLTKHLFGRRAAFATALLYAIGVWFVRHPAECMSEGPFFLAATSWAALLLGERATRDARPCLSVCASALLGGLAFLARPEGAALIVAGTLWLIATGQRRAAVAHAATGTLVCSLLPLGMMVRGHGFTITPKAAFNWDVGAGGSDSALGHYATQWLRWPGDAWEGLGYVAFPLLVYGAIRFGPRRFAHPGTALVLPFLAQLAVVPLLKSHHRFAAGLGVLLLPFAGITLALLWRRLRRHGRVTPLLLLALVLASEAKLFFSHPADRTIERVLGRALAARLAPEDTVVSDMPRLVYFAGLPPPPPRRIEPDDLLRLAADPACRYVALKRGRTAITETELDALGFRVIDLPEPAVDHPSRTEILLLSR